MDRQVKRDSRVSQKPFLALIMALVRSAWLFHFHAEMVDIKFRKTWISRFARPSVVPDTRETKFRSSVPI